MLKCPISTLLYLAKLNIKDKIQDILKIHNNIDVKLTITVKDKDGKIIKVHKQKSHSFVANFMYLLGSLLADKQYNWTDISGSVQQYNSGNMSLAGILDANCSSWGASINNCGIVIGTGTATPTPGDYNLGNQIANGTGSGQMVYNNPSFSTPSVNGNTTSMTITQSFQNQSGASITVTEVGIEVLVYTNSGTNDHALIVHDLLSSPITVANLSILQITYTISVTT